MSRVSFLGDLTLIYSYVCMKKHNTERNIFLYAFAKNDKANMFAKEEAVLSLTAESFTSAADKQVQELLGIGSIWEVLS